MFLPRSTHLVGSQAEQAALAGMKAKETRDVPDKVDKSKRPAKGAPRKLSSVQAQKAFDSYWDKLRQFAQFTCLCVPCFPQVLLSIPFDASMQKHL